MKYTTIQMYQKLIIKISYIFSYYTYNSEKKIPRPNGPSHIFQKKTKKTKKTKTTKKDKKDEDDKNGEKRQKR